MFVLEFKVKPKPQQVQSIDEAIRTHQFVRNKVLRFWIDHRGMGKTELFRYNTKLRKEFKFVEDLNSHACQTAVERVLRAVNRFLANCKLPSIGKKGYPKFKHNSRSVEYKVSGWKLSKDKRHINFTDKKNIGSLKLIGSRDFSLISLDQIKRVRILKRADGYYVQFCCDVDPRTTVSTPLTPSQQAVGIDVGLNYFYTDSQGNTEPIPKFYRKAEKQLNRANRKKSKKFKKGVKQSHNYHKARNRYARKHLRVSRQREEFAKKVALRLIQSKDLIAYEDLNVKSMIKNRRLAKSISDVGWSLFRKWLEYFAYKYGKVTVAVPPHNTSLDCSNCKKKVQKSLSTRTHICPYCGTILDRDHNAAINILHKGLSTVGHTGSKAFDDVIPSTLVDSTNGGDCSSTLIEAILLEQEWSMNQES